MPNDNDRHIEETDRHDAPMAPETPPEMTDVSSPVPGETPAGGEADHDDASAATQPPTPMAQVSEGIKQRWYALHVYSGQEASVKKNLQVHAEQEECADRIGEVLIPVEEVAEIKSGEKKISKRKFFPGYVLVQLPEHPERDARLWHMIKETPGVSGFIGSDRKSVV